MTVALFDARYTPLLRGISLLEASAGTGKTYTIAMLVLRLVVEQGLTVQQILVVTFTKAATEELRVRIRERLQQARRALDARSDDSLGEWLSGVALDADVIRQRLDAALLDIDQAAIFTIHGFCQRVLSEFALHSGQLFDSQLATDISALQQQCADDFWRCQLYPRPAWQVALLTASYATPEALHDSVKGLGHGSRIEPEPHDLDGLFDEIEQTMRLARQDLAHLHRQLLEALAGGLFTKSYRDDLDGQYAVLEAWLENPNQLACLMDAFTQAGILAGLNGSKFRTSKNNPLSSDEQKRAYLSELNLPTTAFDQLDDLLRQLPVQLRRAYCQDAQKRLDQLLTQNNQLSFDDLIRRLADALNGAQANDLITALRERLNAALIDEFQDTDQQQWQIFYRLFGDEQCFLYLIGDPKQAIYQFRGADIFSYFAAQTQAQYQHTLAFNWRSHPQLVAATNGLFLREQPFLQAQLHFHPVQAARSAEEGAVTDGAPLQFWHLDASGQAAGYWQARKGANNEVVLLLRQAVVHEIAQLLEQGQIRQAGRDRSIVASDIAILVRSNRSALEYQAALAEAGVKAVLNNKQSVFDSDEARELYCVLNAVVQADQIELLKSALTLRWFGLDGPALHQLLQDQTALAQWMQRMQDDYAHWQQHGVFSMMTRLWRREQVELQLARLPQAERSLTNLYHLLERVQQEAQSRQLGPQKTLQWLQQTIQQASASEDSQLRLESDADALQIVTLHSAKGLEYPIVFCPDLWHRSDRLKTQSWVHCHEQGQLIADLGSADFAQRRQQAWQEQLAEEIRLFYVAVTRARYRCYLLWANVRTKQQANESAMAYLLELADLDDAEQGRRLSSFALNRPEQYGYRLLNSIEPSLEQAAMRSESGVLAARRFHRSLYSTWQMSSYTALASLSITPELPPDQAFEPDEPSSVAVAELELPRGAQTGNVIHGLLEQLDFAAIARGDDFTSLRQQYCQRFGLRVPQPQAIDHLLQRTVKTPLTPSGFCLSEIDSGRCIKEMPFYLALHDLQVGRLNQLLADSPTCQTLAPKQISGYLTGFIDLIVEHQGRYYVIDYKTNSLDNYAPATLQLAMREHNYGLQYWIYSVVLRQYLQQRLPRYEDAQFGGVFYLFVRGMNPHEAGSGVFFDRPEPQRLQQLATLMMSA